MRDPSGHFELSLLGQEDGEPLPEVTSNHDGRVYAVAETGEDFTVTVHRSSRDYPVRTTKHGTTDTIMVRGETGPRLGTPLKMRQGRRATVDAVAAAGPARRRRKRRRVLLRSEEPRGDGHLPGVPQERRCVASPALPPAAAAGRPRRRAHPAGRLTVPPPAPPRRRHARRVPGLCAGGAGHRCGPAAAGRVGQRRPCRRRRQLPESGVAGAVSVRVPGRGSLRRQHHPRPGDVGRGGGADARRQEGASPLRCAALRGAAGPTAGLREARSPPTPHTTPIPPPPDLPRGRRRCPASRAFEPGPGAPVQPPPTWPPHSTVLHEALAAHRGGRPL
jgi:hypothetical protein